MAVIKPTSEHVLVPLRWFFIVLTHGCASSTEGILTGDDGIGSCQKMLGFFLPREICTSKCQPACQTICQNICPFFVSENISEHMSDHLSIYK